MEAKVVRWGDDLVVRLGDIPEIQGLTAHVRAHMRARLGEFDGAFEDVNAWRHHIRELGQEASYARTAGCAAGHHVEVVAIAAQQRAHHRRLAGKGKGHQRGVQCVVECDVGCAIGAVQAHARTFQQRDHAVDPSEGRERPIAGDVGDAHPPVEGVHARAGRLAHDLACDAAAVFPRRGDQRGAVETVHGHVKPA